MAAGLTINKQGSTPLKNNSTIQFGTYGGGFGAPLQVQGNSINPIQLKTSGGGVGGGGSVQKVASSGGGGGGDNSADLARQAYEARLRQVQRLFDAARESANTIRNQGQSTFQTLIDAVKAYRDRSQTQFTNAGQDITNQASALLGNNARTAQEALGNSRALGRSLGLGDSSKFNAQNRVVSGLAGRQGDTLATQGSNNRANQVNLDANLAQAQQNEGEANTYLKGITDQANQLEALGVGQFADNTDLADNAYKTSLNGIAEYQRQLAALKPLAASSATTFNPSFAGLGNFNPSTLAAPQGVSDPNAANNAYVPTNWLDIINKKPNIGFTY